MSEYAALGSSLMGILGSLTRAGMQGGFVPNYDPVRAAAAIGPNAGSFGNEAVASKARISAVSNPWIALAMADQSGLRNMQQEYIADLMAQASGAKSYAAEESAANEAQMRGAMQTQANSVRDRFARQPVAAAANQGLAGLHQNMILPTEAAMAQEKNQAQDMLQRVLAGVDLQDRQAWDSYRSQRDQADKQRLAAESNAFRHRVAGADEREAKVGELVGWFGVNAKNANR